MHYTIDRSVIPPSCLPSDLDQTNLVDITQVNDSWRKYLDVSTGRIYDGAFYVKLAAEQYPRT